MTIKQCGKILTALLFCCANNLWALPTGPEVLSGSANFVTEGKTLTVEISGKTIIQWRSFDIAKDEAVRFLQDSSGSVVNRVDGIMTNAGSIIYSGMIALFAAKEFRQSGRMIALDETSIDIIVNGVITVEVDAAIDSKVVPIQTSSTIDVGGQLILSADAVLSISASATPDLIIQASSGIDIALTPGWNLLGNGAISPIDVAAKFNAPNKIYSVWKWLPAGAAPGIVYPTWAFYSPQLADGGKAYAESKGYAFLTTIDIGEGFWAYAAVEHTIARTGNRLPTSSFKLADAIPSTSSGMLALPRGWSLIATGDSPTPAQFAAAVTTTAARLSSLWAWDASLSKWSFWTPEMDSDALKNYNQNKGYLDFGAKRLSPSTGFWVNRP